MHIAKIIRERRRGRIHDARFLGAYCCISAAGVMNAAPTTFALSDQFIKEHQFL